MSSLARYFKTQVTAKITTSLKTMNVGDEFSEESGVENSVIVESDANLFGVETTEPYFSEELNAWYCVAFLEKEKAYNHFKSEIELSESIFLTFLERAESENDSISKRTYYKKAWEKGKDFLSKLEYGRLLNPNAEDDFIETKNLLAEIPSLMNDESENLTVRIEIFNDWGNIIYVAVSKSFEEAGFIVSGDGNYSAKIYVEANISGDDPIAAFPSINLELLKSDGKTVFSYQEKVEERTVAYETEMAKKKSYPKLAQKISSNLGDALIKKFGTD